MKEKIYRVIKEHGGFAHHMDISRELLKSEGITERLSRKIIGRTLEGDDRFQCSQEGVWSITEKGLDPMNCFLEETLFTVVDIETTGTSPKSSSITELAAYRVSQGRMGDSFYSMMNPGRYIPPHIERLTGITNEMVKRMPHTDVVIPRFINFLGDSVFVAHNSSFDLSFICRCAVELGGSGLNNHVICTRRMARRLLPDLKSRSLDDVAERLGVRILDRHRAFGDARAAAAILLIFLEMLRLRGIETLGDLLEFQRGGLPPSSALT